MKAIYYIITHTIFIILDMVYCVFAQATTIFNNDSLFPSFAFFDDNNHFNLGDCKQKKVIVLNSPGYDVRTFVEDIAIDSRERIWVTSMRSSSIELFCIQGLGQDDPGNIALTDSDILQNFPNHFREGAWIPFVLAEDKTVRLHVYNSEGALIRSFEPGMLSKGKYTDKRRAQYWDGTAENCKAA